jgi:hypothetical protein
VPTKTAATFPGPVLLILEELGFELEDELPPELDEELEPEFDEEPLLELDEAPLLSFWRPDSELPEALSFWLWLAAGGVCMAWWLR